MELCARCKKNTAAFFITRIEGEKTTNEGLCLRCAKQLGIKPISDIFERMGISDEDIDRIDSDMEALMEYSSGEMDEEGQGKTPPVDFGKLFSSLGGFGPAPSAPTGDGEKKESSGGSKKGKKGSAEKKYLSLYCSDITGKARAGSLDRIIGRERELQRLEQILCRRQKNNPCLIGEPGVGKTAIAEALAIRIVNGECADKLRDKEVYMLDMTSLVAGTQFRGQFETRMKGIIDEAKALGNIILVIDEVHSIVGAGDAEGSMNAANILKPALSRGEIQVIGATTLSEYRKYIEKDSALERRFQPIIVEESSIEDSIKILCGIKGYYESFHGIKIPDAVAERIVILSERYITDRFLPDKAIDLLDEASAHLSLSSPEIARAEAAARALKAIIAEREVIEASDPESDDARNEKYQALAELKSKELAAESELKAASLERDKVVLSIKDIADVIEIWTGIPASNITENEFLRIDKLSERLRERIVGQEEAIDAVARAIKRGRAGISYKKKPVSFIFAGPTGVGKTELVKTLANDLFDSPETLIRLDMSEYMEKFSVSRIIGAPPGYVGYDEAGQLTEKVRRKPYSVILFDEIEKAHPDVLNILLQILDDGRITDASGRVVNFENAVIVMTTNAGSVGVSSSAGFAAKEESAQSAKTEKALSDFLRPEFINRVDEIITFRALSKEDFVKIAEIMLGDIKKTLAEKNISFTFTHKAARALADKAYSVKYGARNLRRTIQREVEDAMAARIVSDYTLSITSMSIDADDDGSIVIVSG